MSFFISFIYELLWRKYYWIYVFIEIAFYAYFRCCLLHRAQILTQPGAKYRDYPCPINDRVRLMRRICRRLERQAIEEPHHDFRKRFSDFLLAWFRPVDDLYPDKKVPGLIANSVSSSLSSSSSGETSSDEDEMNDDADVIKRWTIAGLKKAEVDDFFAWAFFGKETDELNDSERLGMRNIHDELATNYGLTFESGRGGLLEGRRLTLDPVQAIHRLLLVYVVLHLIERLGNIFLRFCGFRRHVAKSGLVYWHRAGQEPDKRLPLLFFHGISPAGKTFYLPLCLVGLGDRQRSIYLFENRAISGSHLTFQELSENATVVGVEEALCRHGDSGRPISLTGHSFGSCPMTWLLHSSLRHVIQQFVLLDPVTILLSEPDVMVNFLYARLEVSEKTINHHLAGIRYVGSELFTEHYLRRCFAWYNSELSLEDLPKSMKVLVCLSENDQILSAPNVKREVEAMGRKDVELIFWHGVDHAHCILDPRTWPELRNSLLAQEQSILKKD